MFRFIQSCGYLGRVFRHAGFSCPFVLLRANSNFEDRANTEYITLSFCQRKTVNICKIIIE
jgi:hypothetical protein